MRPSRGYLFAALMLAVGAASLVFFLWLWSGDGGGGGTGRPVAAPAPPSAAAVQTPAAGSAAPARPQGSAYRADPEGDADPTRDLKSYVVRGEHPGMGEVIKRLHERGIHTGLGAFSPPGTSPPLVGLAVPEDFKLPEGYVRHHQSTDDGQPIEAILMFAPGFQPLDGAGKPVPVPQDRVVPPELAPAGLPLRRIVIPPPSDPAALGR
jgi:hypothetical protein